MVDGIVRHSHYGSSTVPYLNDHLALVRALHILLAWNQDVLSISVEGRQKTFRLKFTCKYKEPTKLFTLIILDKPACQLREGNFSAHPVPRSSDTTLTNHTNHERDWLRLCLTCLGNLGRPPPLPQGEF